LNVSDFVRSARELLTFRALLNALVARDLKARYRAFGLGYLWSLVNPLLQLAIYTWVFRNILGIATPAFTVFLAAGLLPWTWFNTALSVGTLSVIHGGSLLRRMYFPSHVLPIAVVITHLIHFLLSLPVLLLFVTLYDRALGAPLLALPAVIAIQFLLTTGATLIVAALNVRFRDLELLLGNALLLLFFVTPILYPLEQVPERFRWVLLLNPLTGIMDGYQRILYWNAWPEWRLISWSLAAALAVFALGWLVFEHRRWSFAEQV
jgi:lipopolysaccharide transport system permease protein